jgi:hypothetical protein
VVIRAGLAADGYLVLLDSYDPDWIVDVDGAAAPLMRVNALFRAVHLTGGGARRDLRLPPAKALSGRRDYGADGAGAGPRGGAGCAAYAGCVRPGARLAAARARAVACSRPRPLHHPQDLFIRDLSFFFWSRHLWLRHAVAGGEAPLVGSLRRGRAVGDRRRAQPAADAGDAGHPLLPSPIVAFNLWVALPLPLAALGTFLFLRRRMPAQAAALGACAFALSGPIVSMLNMPNLAWSVAFLPWVLFACDRLLERASAGWFTTVAVIFALQALSGEPVTWASTGFVAVAYAFFGPHGIFRLEAEATRLRTPEWGSLVASAFRRNATVVAALAAGALLAAAQLVPTVLAGVRAERRALSTPDFWSLHPFALWETLAPHLFGNYYDAFLADLPWMGALNFGRDPFFYSLYVGPLVLLLAGLGSRRASGATRSGSRSAWCFSRPPRRIYAALSLLRRLFPPLMYFRFPVKYIVVSLFACAVLAAEGFAAIFSSGISA